MGKLRRRLARSWFTLALAFTAALASLPARCGGFDEWTSSQLWSFSVDIHAVHWVAGQGWFLAGEGQGTYSEDLQSWYGLVLKSPNGIAPWADLGPTYTEQLAWEDEPGEYRAGLVSALASDGDRLVAVGNDRHFAIGLNAPGTWSLTGKYAFWGGDIVRGTDRFVAIDYWQGALHTSVNGMAWFADEDWDGEDDTPGDGNDYTGFNTMTLDPAMGRQVALPWHYGMDYPVGICHDGQRYMAVGGFGAIATSTDGTTWTRVRPDRFDRKRLFDVVAKDGVFVAVGENGQILRSDDEGGSWELSSSATTEHLFSVAAGGTWFAAVGANGALVVSHDGITWTALDIGANGSDLTAIGYGDGRFLIASASGRAYLSGPEPLPVSVQVFPPGAGTTNFTGQTIVPVAKGSSLQLSATPATGYRFAGWTGHVQSSAAEISATVNAATALTANFVSVTPTAVAFREGPEMKQPRMGHRAVALADGRVLVFGGHTTAFTRSATMEQTDAGRNQFASVDLPVPSDGAALAVLADGRILLAGGASDDLGIAPGISDALVVDVSTGLAVESTTGTMVHPRMNARAARLLSDCVLIVGGWFDFTSSTYPELFDPTAGTFSQTGALGQPRSEPLVIPTADGGAVVAGGTAAGGGYATAVEYYSSITKSFTTVEDSLFGDGEPWVLVTDLAGDVQAHRRPDGSYVFSAWHRVTLQVALALFDPESGSFARVELFPELKLQGGRVLPPVLASGTGQVMLLTASTPMDVPDSCLLLHIVDPASGSWSSPTAPVTIAGYVPNAATLLGVDRIGSTELMLIGGSSTVGQTTNFTPVARTFFFTPRRQANMDDPMCVAIDFHGFRHGASNNLMVRAEDGTLHTTYTRAVNAEATGDWFCFVRSRSPDGDWGGEVRTEHFPDSCQANSLVLDSSQTLHQGLTFNVGAFHTTSTNGGASWKTPTALRDGGWGKFDYAPQLALYQDKLQTVFSSCFGWYDYPSNLVYRTWLGASRGWGTEVMLTDVPNVDALERGAEHPRFQIGPDGTGHVLYELSTTTAPPQMQLITITPAGDILDRGVISNPGRYAKGGDLAMDPDGNAHLVWLEADAADGAYAAHYRCYQADGLLTPAVSVTATSEPSALSVTVAAYPGRRTLIAYDLAAAEPGAASHGGVFVRKLTDTTFSAPLQVGSTLDAHSPGLRAGWNMPHPNTIDICWVEVYPWGSQLLHSEMNWASMDAPEQGQLTITSSVPDATFTLNGPVSGIYTLNSGVWTDSQLPAGRYTINWHPVDGQQVPPAQTVDIAGNSSSSTIGAYMQDGRFRIRFATAPTGAGQVHTLPDGERLLDGDRAYDPAEMPYGTVTMQAVPAEGMAFTRWSYVNDLGMGTFTQNPLQLVVDRDFTVTAEFEPGGPFRITTAYEGSGTITPSVTLAAGTSFTCMIQPAAGEPLSDVLVDGVSQGAVTTLTLDGLDRDHEIRALAEPQATSITVVRHPEEGGTVTASPTTYGLGDTVTLTATPAEGFRFTGWSGDATGAATVVNLPLTGHHALTAGFALKPVLAGDANADGSVTLEDAVLARRMYAGTAPVDMVRADLDGDETLGPADIAGILQCSLGAGASDSRLVSPGQATTLAGGVIVSLPGTWPASATQVTVTGLASAALPPLPSPFERASATYHIQVGAASTAPAEFGLGLPAPESGTLQLLYLDPAENAWVPVPTEAQSPTRSAPARGASRSDTVIRGSGLAPGSYCLGKLPPASEYQGAHCVVYYTPSLAHTIGGASVAAVTFAAAMAAAFDKVYDTYAASGYSVPNYTKRDVGLFITSVTLDQRADIYLSTDTTTYSEAEYSWKTKNYYSPTSFDSSDEMEATMAHEMFHAIQNQSFTGAGMGANRWLMEMTAEYASDKAGFDPPQALGTAYRADLTTPLGAINQIHEYACAHFLDYILTTGGGTFKDLWINKLSGSYTPHARLASYIKDTCHLSMGRLHARFLDAVLFDTAVTVPLSPVTTSSWDTGNQIDQIVSVTGKNAMGWLQTKAAPFSDFPASVLVEFPAGIPPQTNAKITVADVMSRQVAGGRAPLGSFYSGNTLMFAVADLAKRQDAIYATMYNYYGSETKSARVTIRPITATLVHEPTNLMANAPCTFTATVDIVPQSAVQLKVYWKMGDDSLWHTETVPATTREFVREHTFANPDPESFDVTFELHAVDADGNRRKILDRTKTVAVAAHPAIQILPAVIEAEQGQRVTLGAAPSNGPATPEYVWTFGDSSAQVITDIPAVQHVYSQSGNFGVSVTMRDTVLPSPLPNATGSGLVRVNPPPHTVDPPPQTAPPNAQAIDYATLTRVDETRWWDGMREIYYQDAAGRKHGLYRTLLPNGSPLEIGMYIHGAQEGRWQIYWQDGTGRIEQRHFHWNLATQTDSWPSPSTAMGRFTDATTFSFVPSIEASAQDWPACMAGLAATIIYADGVTVETVTFDSSGRRDGPCSIMRDGQLLMQGSFAVGVKTGFWIYYHYAATGTATDVLSHNHSADPPNHLVP